MQMECICTTQVDCCSSFFFVCLSCCFSFSLFACSACTVTMLDAQRAFPCAIKCFCIAWGMPGHTGWFLFIYLFIYLFLFAWATAMAVNWSFFLVCQVAWEMSPWLHHATQVNLVFFKLAWATAVMLCHRFENCCCCIAWEAPTTQVVTFFLCVAWCHHATQVDCCCCCFCLH